MKIFKIAGWLLLIAIAVCIVYIATTVFLICDMPLLLAEDYATIYVDQSDAVDAVIMRNPTEKFRNLSSLDAELREEVAKHMEKNRLKLKEGKHKFRIYYTDGKCRRYARDGEWENALIEGEWIKGRKISGFEFAKINE